ncbi:MAG: ParA family protein, partial [Snowella sp.]
MNKSYVIWNNKGGVGKSTITFHIASRYAEKNLDRNVVVIDMCPQANSSMMLMGGGTEAESRLQELIIGDVPKTVVGFLTDSVLKNDISDTRCATKNDRIRVPNDNLILLIPESLVNQD